MTANDGKVTPEDAVRGYIEYLRDPKKFPADNSEAESVQKRIAQLLDSRETSDPIAYINKRAALALELDAAKAGEDPGIKFRADFVAMVRDYLQALPVDQVTGVQLLKEAGGRKINDALRDAGLVSGSGSTGVRSSGAVRAQRLDLEEKKAGVPSTGTFTMSDYAHAIDRNPATANNYLKELLESGYVNDAGVDESSTSPRKPRLYTKA